MRKEMEVQIAGGLEARPIAVLVQVASQYDSTVYLQVGTRKVNAKSIMGMMSLGLDAGEKVTVIVDGTDEKEALADIEKYLSTAE